MENRKWKKYKQGHLFRFWILILVAFVQLGCPSETQPKECDEFFNSYARQDESVFAGYDLEKQLTIHLCGLDRHPPSDYSYEIADRGKIIVPVLLEKLNKDYKNSYDAQKTKLGIIFIFQRLASRGQLGNDNAVIAAIERAVAEIKTDWMREEAKESLADIKKNVGVPVKQ